MPDNDINLFVLKYEKIRATDHKADLSPLILAKLAKVTTRNDRLTLHSLLAGEYEFLGKLREAEEIYIKLIEANGDHPLDWMNYAMHLHYWAKDLKRALTAADRAVERAQAFGDLVTKTHAARIRIALALARYDIVAASLKALTEYEPPPTSHDAEVGFESDFLAAIPAGAIDDELAERFRRHVVGHAPFRRHMKP